MLVKNLLDHRQAEPGAGLLRGHVRFEGLAEDGLGEAASIITNDQTDCSAFAGTGFELRGNADLGVTALGCVDAVGN